MSGLQTPIGLRQANPVWRNIALLSASQGLTVTIAVMLVTSGPVVGKGLASDESLATLPVSIQFLATLFSLIPMSRFMQRRSRMAGFMLGALLGMIGAGLGAYAIWSAQFTALCLAAIFLGAAAAAAQFLRFAAADAAPPTIRPRALSLVVAGGVVAAFAGPLLSRWSRDMFLPHAFLGNFAVMGILFVLTLLTAACLRLPVVTGVSANQPHDENDERPTAVILRDPRLIMAIAAGMTGYGIMSLIMTATPLAILACGYQFSDAAFVIQWHVVAMFLPSFVTGHLIAKFGHLRILGAGLGLMIVAVVIGLSGVDLSQFWFGLFAVGVGWNFLYVGGSALLTTVYRPSERAKIQAINDALVFVAAAGASFASGAVNNLWGWSAVNLAAVPLILLLVGVGAACRRGLLSTAKAAVPLA